jgi:hypothetical protein
MNFYKIYTIKENTLLWKCFAESDENVWEAVSQAKQLPITELKKLFKIKKT